MPNRVGKSAPETEGTSTPTSQFSVEFTAASAAGFERHGGHGQHQRQRVNQHRVLAAPRTSQAGDFGRARIQRRVWARWIPYPNSRVGA